MNAKLWTRKCRGCKDQSPHSHHLTWFGRFYFRYLAGGFSRNPYRAQEAGE